MVSNDFSSTRVKMIILSPLVLVVARMFVFAELCGFTHIVNKRVAVYIFRFHDKHFVYTWVTSPFKGYNQFRGGGVIAGKEPGAPVNFLTSQDIWCGHQGAGMVFWAILL